MRHVRFDLIAPSFLPTCGGDLCPTSPWLIFHPTLSFFFLRNPCKNQPYPNRAASGGTPLVARELRRKVRSVCVGAPADQINKRSNCPQPTHRIPCRGPLFFITAFFSPVFRSSRGNYRHAASSHKIQLCIFALILRVFAFHLLPQLLSTQTPNHPRFVFCCQIRALHYQHCTKHLSPVFIYCFNTRRVLPGTRGTRGTKNCSIRLSLLSPFSSALPSIFPSIISCLFPLLSIAAFENEIHPRWLLPAGSHARYL